MQSLNANAIVSLCVGLISVLVLACRATAHCDTLSGPVIADAQAALEKRDVTPVLKWVTADAEGEIKAAFAKTIEVRRGGGAAAELADRYFFETLVRVHRAGEGAPFTGLKDDDVEIEPGIEAADEALSTGKIDAVIDDVTRRLAEGLRERFERVVETREHKDRSVEEGREFVEAYVDYIHYAERLYREAEGSGGHAVHAHESEGERSEDFPSESE